MKILLVGIILLMAGCTPKPVEIAPKSVLLAGDTEIALKQCDLMRSFLLANVQEAYAMKPTYDGLSEAEKLLKLMKMLNCRNFDPT